MPYVGPMQTNGQPAAPTHLARSRELLARARGLIPGASQTMSKGPTQWAQGVAPTYVERAAGCRVWDVDGNEYIDLPMGLGPMILGHGHPAVNAAITEQLGRGITYTLPHPLEIDVAQRIVDIVPGVERVRFAKTGSDVTSAAIRLARGLTGRDRVIVAGYHGWHDWYIGSTSWPLGVPRQVAELVEAVPAADVDALQQALERRRGEIAAVIIEPAGAKEPGTAGLQQIIDLTHDHGALAVFDEIVTGLRLAPGGAQQHYGVQADLTCLGKALGNGMPIAALAGRASHMDELERIFFSGTHGGEALSLAAAAATLDVFATEPVNEHLWRQGTALQHGVREAVARHRLEDWISCSGPAPMTIVTVREPVPGGDLPAKTLLQQEMLKRGVLYNSTHLLSYAHGDRDITEVVSAYDETFEILAAALPDRLGDYLEAPAVGPVFRSH
jgi:glutamate-1-semialdehyde aminotransferase